jgi:hypothetical protein
MNCRTIRASLYIGAVLLIAPSVAVTPAAAQGQSTSQEEGKVGITMGFPASIGVIIHATDKVAIRPELSFSTSASEGTVSSTSDGWTVGTGVSALFYVAMHDHVLTYVSPRITYSRLSTTSTSTVSTTVATFTSTTSLWSGAGSFGAQYSPTPKFSVFGEVGMAYSHQTGHSSVSSGLSVPPTDVKGHQWGTRAGVGVIFYP